MAKQPVRTATPSDVAPVSAMLARAFEDDPVTCHLLPAPRRRLAHARHFFAWQMRRLLPQEQVHVADDGSGAALWALPNRWRESPWEALGLVWRIMPAVALHLHDVLPAINAVERAHPRGAHMYLSVLGTEPSAQGRGVGSAVIAKGLELADAEGLPSFLESSKERNIDFYSRFGFRVIDELRLPRGGPSLWPMWREPGGGR